MKKIKIIYKALLVLILISACKDENNLDFLNDIPLPTNVGANFGITQDNSGLVTITPYAEGATSSSCEKTEPTNIKSEARRMSNFFIK